MKKDWLKIARETQTISCNSKVDQIERHNILRAAYTLLDVSKPKFEFNGKNLEKHLQEDYEQHISVKMLCEWWSKNAPKGMEKAEAFAISYFDLESKVFLSPNPVDEEFIEYDYDWSKHSCALFEHEGVMITFLRGKDHITKDDKDFNGSVIHCANGKLFVKYGIFSEINTDPGFGVMLKPAYRSMDDLNYLNKRNKGQL